MNSRWTEQLKYRIRNFMMGRYGMDEMSKELCILGIVIMFVSLIPRLSAISLISWLILLYSYFRCFSRNIVRRSIERDRYLKSTDKLRRRINTLIRRWKDRKVYKYYRCPSCKAMVRVPRGKGHIIITCPKCRTEMKGRT